MNKEKSIPEDENEKIKLMRMKILMPFFAFIIGVVSSSQLKGIGEATKIPALTLFKLMLIFLVLIYATIIRNQEQKIKDIEKKLGK